jgi:hypothetical protein
MSSLKPHSFSYAGRGKASKALRPVLQSRKDAVEKKTKDIRTPLNSSIEAKSADKLNSSLTLSLAEASTVDRQFAEGKQVVISKRADDLEEVKGIGASTPRFNMEAEAVKIPALRSLKSQRPEVPTSHAIGSTSHAPKMFSGQAIRLFEVQETKTPGSAQNDSQGFILDKSKEATKEEGGKNDFKGRDEIKRQQGVSKNLDNYYDEIDFAERSPDNHPKAEQRVVEDSLPRVKMLMEEFSSMKKDLLATGVVVQPDLEDSFEDAWDEMSDQSLEEERLEVPVASGQYQDSKQDVRAGVGGEAPFELVSAEEGSGSYDESSKGVGYETVETEPPVHDLADAFALKLPEEPTDKRLIKHQESFEDSRTHKDTKRPWEMTDDVLSRDQKPASSGLQETHPPLQAAEACQQAQEDKSGHSQFLVNLPRGVLETSSPEAPRQAPVPVLYAEAEVVVRPFSPEEASDRTEATPTPVELPRLRTEADIKPTSTLMAETAPWLSHAGLPQLKTEIAAKPASVDLQIAAPPKPTPAEFHLPSTEVRLSPAEFLSPKTEVIPRPTPVELPPPQNESSFKPTSVDLPIAARPLKQTQAELIPQKAAESFTSTVDRPPKPPSSQYDAHQSLPLPLHEVKLASKEPPRRTSGVVIMRESCIQVDLSYPKFIEASVQAGSSPPSSADYRIITSKRSYREHASPPRSTREHRSNVPKKHEFSSSFAQEEDTIDRVMAEARAKDTRKHWRLIGIKKIQALVRGFIARRQVAKQRERMMEQLKARKLVVLRARIRRSWAPYRIMKALKRWHVIQHHLKQVRTRQFQIACAVTLQKWWRGTLTRLRLRPVVKARDATKSKLEGLALGWKVRRIFKTRAIFDLKKQIKDTLLLISELSRTEGSSDLVKQLKLQQLPSIRRKFLQEVYRMWCTGAWVKAPLPKPVVKRPALTLASPKGQIEESLPTERSLHDTSLTENLPNDRSFSQRSLEGGRLERSFSREEKPLAQMKINYDEVEDFAPEQSKAPKKTFSNFLKRKEKYDPRKAALTAASKPKQPDIINEMEERRESAFDERPIKPVAIPLELSQAEPELQQEKPRVDEDKSPKPFLKRKSQAIKAQKVNWKVTPRIDCWVSEANTKPKAKPRISQVPSARTSKQAARGKEVSQGRIMHVDELEGIFNGLSAEHETAYEFFSRPERMKETLVPQFQTFSYFITDFTEDIYQETLEALEQHFDFLCNEEVFA